MGCSEARRPCRSAPQELNFRNSIVTPQPWNRLAGGHAGDPSAVPPYSPTHIPSPIPFRPPLLSSFIPTSLAPSLRSCRLPSLPPGPTRNLLLPASFLPFRPPAWLPPISLPLLRRLGPLHAPTGRYEQPRGVLELPHALLLPLQVQCVAPPPRWRAAPPCAARQKYSERHSSEPQQSVSAHDSTSAPPCAARHALDRGAVARLSQNHAGVFLGKEPRAPGIRPSLPVPRATDLLGCGPASLARPRILWRAACRER